MTVLDQSFSGYMSFSQVTTEDGEDVLSIGFSDVQLDMGDAVSISQDETQYGAFIINSSGMAGTMQANVNITGSPDVSFGSGFGVAINTMPVPVSESGIFELNGEDRTYAFDLPAGQYFRVDGTDIELIIFNQTLRGDLALSYETSAGPDQIIGNGDDTQVLTVGVSNLSLDLVSGQSSIPSVSNGQGFFVMDSSGLAGRLSASVVINVPEVDFAGNFSLEVNTKSTAVTETFQVGTDIITLDFTETAFLRIAGENISLTVAGQTLGGEFVFDVRGGSASEISVAFTNVTLGFGDGQTEIVSVTNGQGQFSLT